MSDRHPIEAGFGDDEEPEEPASGVSEDAFKEALSHHAAGVTIVAVRSGATVHATTVTSFASIAVDPPVVMVSVGGNAQVLPFLDEGAEFAVSLLRDDQRRLATVYADSFPVGPSPFPPEGPPVIPDALAWLRCRAERVVTLADTRVVLGRVVELEVGAEGPALVRYRRTYHALP